MTDNRDGAVTFAAFCSLQRIVSCDSQELWHPRSCAGAASDRCNADSHFNATLDLAAFVGTSPQVLDCGAYFFGHFGCACRPGQGKDDRDVFCAVGGSDIDCAQNSHDGSRRFRQTDVAFAWTPVMQLAEVGTIEQHESEMRAFALGAAPFAVERFIEAAGGGEAGAG